MFIIKFIIFCTTDINYRQDHSKVQNTIFPHINIVIVIDNKKMLKMYNINNDIIYYVLFNFIISVSITSQQLIKKILLIVITIPEQILKLIE